MGVERISLGKSGMTVSKVGFGGIPIQRLAKEEALRVIRRALDLGVDWLDTANGYTCSEEYIGEAVKSYDRAALKIFSKSPARDPETLRSHVELSLHRLDTPYLDLYQFHNVSDPESLSNTREKLLPVLLDFKAKGLIRHIGASSHTEPGAMELLEWPESEVLQFPFSFIVEDIGRRVLAKAQEKNAGFIAMKPFGGGMIEDAPLCTRFLMGFPALAMDPGFETIAEVEEIIAAAAGPGLSQADEAAMARIARELGRTFCRRCQYCMPCPQGVIIVNLTTMDSSLKRLAPGRILNGWVKDAAVSAANCTRCGQCEPKCPYKLPIMDRVSQGARAFEEYARAHRTQD